MGVVLSCGSWIIFICEKNETKHKVFFVDNHLQTVPSSQTVMRMLPSRLRLVCRMAVVHCNELYINFIRFLLKLPLDGKGECA